MKFSDTGIIISQKNYSENSIILKLFTKQHGVFRGFVNSYKSKKTQAIFQVGNLISFEWRSRIEEGLGQFHYLDLIKSYGSRIIFDKLKLSCLSSLFSIIDSCFIEREEHEELFDAALEFLKKISDESSDKKDYLADYIKLELNILKSLGYGIDLSSCVVTESYENLTYVSPKSARAVSFEAGKPYADKLLKLPSFLIAQNDNIESSHLSEGLKLSGFFLEKFIFAERNVRPANRGSIESEVLRLS